MGKYTSPAVTMADVLAAMPRVPSTTTLTCRIVPVPGDGRRVYCTVEWAIGPGKGVSLTLKRWGQQASASSPTGHVSALLLAAQEAWNWFEGKDGDELAAFAAWQVATL